MPADLLFLAFLTIISVGAVGVIVTDWLEVRFGGRS